MPPPVRVLFQCTGVGILNRGIESFFRESYDGLKTTPGIDAILIKGAGQALPGEKTALCLPRTSWLAGFLGRMTGRNGYAVEQWTSFFHVAMLIRRIRPEVIFYSDSNLGFLLFRFRKLIGVPYKLLFSNGGPCRPPFIRRDFVQQVAPLYLEEALEYGESAERHILLPYGIAVPPVENLQVDQPAIRQHLGLPLARKIVLSVGWIAREHKRMHYVIEEMARLPEPRPFLQLLGAIDEASPEIIEMGNRLLGTDNFAVRSVPYEEVAAYYDAADCFVLGSLKEGFGRVYLESLLHGLPTIGHRHPVIEYVLGDAGIVADLSEPGGLAPVLEGILSQPVTAADRLRRWKSVRDRFSWEALAPAYLKMFQKCASGEPLGNS